MDVSQVGISNVGTLYKVIPTSLSGTKDAFSIGTSNVEVIYKVTPFMDTTYDDTYIESYAIEVLHKIFDYDSTKAFYFSGDVIENSLPADRVIYAYDSIDGTLAGKALSLDGNYTLYPTTRGNKFLVCIDDIPLLDYNNLVIADVDSLNNIDYYHLLGLIKEYAVPAASYILENNPDINIGDDGNYWLETANNAEQAHLYCDMTTSSGGWALICDYEYNRTAKPDNFTYVHDAWFSYAPSNITTSGCQWQSITTNIEQAFSYTAVMIKLVPHYYGTPDDFDNSIGVHARDDINGQYCDGISITSGGLYDKVHILTCTNGSLGTTRLATGLSWIGADHVIGFNGQEIVHEKNISKTSKPIKVRFMADQANGAEDIGFYKLQIYIK